MRSGFVATCWWLWIVFVFTVGRLGEGPTEPVSYGLTLGTCNPTGLSHKALSCLELPTGIFAVSETQLTAAGAHQFRKDLRFHAGNRRLRLVHGEFAPTRSRSSSAEHGRG